MQSKEIFSNFVNSLLPSIPILLLWIFALVNAVLKRKDNPNKYNLVIIALLIDISIGLTSKILYSLIPIWETPTRLDILNAWSVFSNISATATSAMLLYVIFYRTGDSVAAPANTPSEQKTGPSSLPLNFVPSRLPLAIISTLFCMPFGVVAIVYSTQVNSKLKYNDIDGAVESSKKALTWAWTSIGIGIFTNAITAAYIFVMYYP